MNATATPSLFRSFVNAPPCASKDLFRQRFQRSLRACLRRGFCVEESFGMIWIETWEEVPLNEKDQGEVYEELINWAKNALA
jgi:hypothetical protein